MRKLLPVLFIVIAFPCLSNNTSLPDSLLQSLIGEWNYQNLGNSKLLALSKDSFTLSTDNSEEALKGFWLVEGSKLILNFALKPDTAEVDSSVYLVSDGKPSLIYFKDGKELARIADDALTPSYVSKDYEIIDVQSDKMVLEENGISLILNRKEIKLKASSANKDLYKTEGISFNSIWRGLVGLATLIFIAFLFSSNRKAISWPLVGKGLLIQLIFAILVLKVPFVTSGFEIVSGFFIKIISFTQEGTDFLFGSFVTGKIEMALINFVIQVLPTIVFFAALTSLLYYWGVLQKIVYVFAWLMRKVMKLSGAESLAAAGNIFLGQTESPLLIRPYLDKMTKSELMCLMSGGMATIAGGVLAAYIGFLGGSDPVQQMFYAKHLLAASVMSAPAAIVAAKILVPETESFNEKMEISNERFGSNALEAIANGTTEGIKLAVNVAGMLLVFIAFIAMANYIFQDLIGAGLGINEKIAEATNGRYDGLSLQFIFGLVFAPLSWLMGVAKEDIVLVGQLLGEKTILNEFVAYVSLGEMKEAGVFVSEKSIIMATYILCGFANFASIGIQIGGIGSLIPGRKGLLASLGIRALIGGTLASLFTAVLVGMIY